MNSQESKNYNVYSFIKHSGIELTCPSDEKKFLETNLYSNDLIIYKILILGDRSSGKTNLCKRFAINEFSLETKTSSNIEYYLKLITIFDKNILIFVINIDKRYINHVKDPKLFDILSNLNGVIVLYDITNYISFEIVEKIVDEIRYNCGSEILIFVAGNKNDLTNLREVDEEKARQKVNELKCEFKEINCVDNDSVHMIFKDLIANLYFNNLEDKEKQKLLDDL